MAYTTHGWHIPGTVKDETNPLRSCGGPSQFCEKCLSEVKELQEKMDIEMFENEYVQENHKIIKKVVGTYIKENYRRDLLDSSEDALPPVNIVWFSKVLQNWKALAISDYAPAEIYFEITYNGDRKVIYLDVYIKNKNITIPVKDI